MLGRGLLLLLVLLPALTSEPLRYCHSAGAILNGYDGQSLHPTIPSPSSQKILPAAFAMASSSSSSSSSPCHPSRPPPPHVTASSSSMRAFPLAFAAQQTLSLLRIPRPSTAPPARRTTTETKTRKRPTSFSLLPLRATSSGEEEERDYALYRSSNLPDPSPTTPIIDLRSPSLFATSHPSGATSIPLPSLKSRYPTPYQPNQPTPHLPPPSSLLPPLLPGFTRLSSRPSPSSLSKLPPPNPQPIAFAQLNLPLLFPLQGSLSYRLPGRSPSPSSHRLSKTSNTRTTSSQGDTRP